MSLLWNSCSLGLEFKTGNTEPGSVNVVKGNYCSGLYSEAFGVKVMDVMMVEDRLRTMATSDDYGSHGETVSS